MQRLQLDHVREKLQAMKDDPNYYTTTSYSANGQLYPDHRMPFVDKHIAYLLNHPQLDSRYYLSNLRLMLKKR